MQVRENKLLLEKHNPLIRLAARTIVKNESTPCDQLEERIQWITLQAIVCQTKWK